MINTLVNNKCIVLFCFILFILLILIICITKNEFYYSGMIKPKYNEKIREPFGVVAVVGNGKISKIDRENIEKSDYVLRFNDMKYFKNGERVDGHFCRHRILDNKYPGLNMFNKEDNIYSILCALKKYEVPANIFYELESGIERYNLFINCNNNENVEKYKKKVEKWVSSGIVAISELQKNENVNEIHVYGMNWNFPVAGVHSPLEKDLINSCCTKCNINKINTESYW